MNVGAATVCALVGVAISASAGAFIPAAPPPGEGFDGPGLICEPGFNFAVEAGERVVIDPQYEPWYPISDTLRTPLGWATLTSRSESDLQSRKWRKPGKGERVTSNDMGTIYQAPIANELLEHAAYYFVPAGTRQPSARIAIWKEMPGVPAPRLEGVALAHLFARISSGPTAGEQCLNLGVGSS